MVAFGNGYPAFQPPLQAKIPKIPRAEYAVTGADIEIPVETRRSCIWYRFLKYSPRHQHIVPVAEMRILDEPDPVATGYLIVG